MAATVVSVVIFLCGVLVGRGVRAQMRRRRRRTRRPASVAETTPTQPRRAGAGARAAGSDPTTAAAPPPAADELSYFNRLEKPNPPAEQLKPAPDKRPAKPRRASRRRRRGEAPRRRRRRAAGQGAAARAGPGAPRRRPPRRASASEPSGQGFAVQIAALNVRSEADAIAKRLSSKGYAAYVLSPANGTPSVYPRPRRQVQHAARSRDDRRQAAKRRAVQALGYALATASGVLLALSFPKFGHPAFAWIALAPLLVALARHDAAPRVPARSRHRRRLLHRHALLDHAT